MKTVIFVDNIQFSEAKHQKPVLQFEMFGYANDSSATDTKHFNTNKDTEYFNEI